MNCKFIVDTLPVLKVALTAAAVSHNVLQLLQFASKNKPKTKNVDQNKDFSTQTNTHKFRVFQH